MTYQERVKFVVKKLHLGEIQTLASSMAFISALSLMPLVAISLSIFHALGGLEKIFPLIQDKIVDFFSIALSEKILGNFKTMTSSFKPSSIGIPGFFLLTITSTKLISEIDNSIQTIWGLKDKSSIYKRYFIYWLIIFFVPIGIAVAVGLLTSTYLTSLIFFPVNFSFFILAILGLFMIYKFVPRTHVSSKTSLMASLITAALFKLSQVIYFYVIGNLLNYNKLYGSLAFIPTFLIWILILWYIFLFGVAISASLMQKPS